MKGRISKTIYLTGQFWLIEVCNPDYETGVRFSVTVSLLFLTTTFHNPNVLRFFFFFVVVLFSLTEALPILYCAMSRSPAGTSSSLIFFQNNFVFFFLFLAHFFPPFPDNSNSWHVHFPDWVLRFRRHLAEGNIKKKRVIMISRKGPKTTPTTRDFFLFLLFVCVITREDSWFCFLLFFLALSFALTACVINSSSSSFVVVDVDARRGGCTFLPN